LIGFTLVPFLSGRVEVAGPRTKCLIVLLLITTMKHTGNSVFVQICDWVSQLVKS